jgi:hypothetical protein
MGQTISDNQHATKNNRQADYSTKYVIANNQKAKRFLLARL